jgi:hypothetical protein
MARSSNTSSGLQYSAITRMDQKVMSRMIPVDVPTLDMQNATIAARKMKDFIAMLAELSPFQVETQIEQLNEQVAT